MPLVSTTYPFTPNASNASDLVFKANTKMAGDRGRNTPFLPLKYASSQRNPLWGTVKPYSIKFTPRAEHEMPLVHLLGHTTTMAQFF